MAKHIEMWRDDSFEHKPSFESSDQALFTLKFYCCEAEGLVPRYLFEQESQAKYVANHIGVWDDVFERDPATNHSRDFL